MFKRLMPRARGMAYLIRRRSAHIAIGLLDLTKLTEEQAERRGDGGVNPPAPPDGVRRAPSASQPT